MKRPARSDHSDIRADRYQGTVRRLCQPRLLDFHDLPVFEESGGIFLLQIFCHLWFIRSVVMANAEEVIIRLFGLWCCAVDVPEMETFLILILTRVLTNINAPRPL